MQRAFTFLIAISFLQVAPLTARTESTGSPRVEELGPIGAHSVWVPDRIFGHSRLYDGDTGKVLAIIDAPNMLTPMPPLHAPSRGEIYAVEIDYSRGRRGDRLDYVSIYDARTLFVIDEILLPHPTAESNTSIAHAALLDDERFLLVFSQFPATLVTIVDLETRSVAGEVAIAGCAGIYPAGARRFATLCGDGTTALVVLDTNGKPIRTERSAAFFDVVEDPLAMAGGRIGQDWIFVSFAGQVHRIQYAGDRPLPAEPWPLASAEERASGWRPGGLQHVAVHRASKLLFVVMHEGKPGSHKDAGPEIWRYDLSARTRTARLATSNLTADMFGPMIGIESGGFSDWLLHWVLDSPGVHSIAISQDAAPVLFARNAELGIVAALDPESGELLRNLEEAGIAGPTLGVP